MKKFLPLISILLITMFVLAACQPARNRSPHHCACSADHSPR